MNAGAIAIGVIVVAVVVYVQIGDLFKREFSRKETIEGTAKPTREDD